MFKVPEHYRITTGAMASDESYGNEGLFIFTRDFPKFKAVQVRCIASCGMGWEHVSVSIYRNECPTWEMMALVKDMFWDAEDCVVQYHPPKSQYVNCHKFVLHLWRKKDFEFPVPDSVLVGPKG